MFKESYSIKSDQIFCFTNILKETWNILYQYTNHIFTSIKVRFIALEEI
jgi:hypothetical protein